jgi:hypothetical protein
MQQNTVTVTEAAAEIAEELLICGHEDISAIDILDALASTGYTLVKDSTDTARVAFLSALTPSK